MFWRKLGFKRPLNEGSEYQANPQWQAKKLAMQDVADKIPNGSRIFIGSTAAMAHATLNAIVTGPHNLLDINILQFIPGANCLIWKSTSVEFAPRHFMPLTALRKTSRTALPITCPCPAPECIVSSKKNAFPSKWRSSKSPHLTTKVYVAWVLG